MEPEKLRGLAEFIDSLNGYLSLPRSASPGIPDHDVDALCCAAAVLREVAGLCGGDGACCGNCHFWIPFAKNAEGMDSGDCRKSAPVVSDAATAGGYHPNEAWFPEMQRGGWCGEYVYGEAPDAFAAKDAEISQLTDEVMGMTNEIGTLAAYLMEERGLKFTSESACATAVRLLRETHG